MSVVDSRYEKLCPRREILQDEVVLAQAWKKTHTFIRRHNWYADVLELDASAICLSRNLAAWSSDIALGEYKTTPAWLVPAPKNGLWCFKSEDEGGWQPRVAPGDEPPVLRPLAHIGIREQTVATAVMLCLADCIETAQGDTALSAERAVQNRVFSYGNRLFCNWSNNHTQASFPWGNSNTYSRYFQDYQKYVERPATSAKAAEVDENESVFVVTLDLSAFFDNIDIKLLIQKMKEEYQQFYDKTGDDLKPANEAFWETAERALNFEWREEDQELNGLFRDNKLPSGLPQGLVSSGFFANVYMLSFDRAVGGFIDRRPPKKSFRVHDYCRYVDDLKLVVSVDKDEDRPHDLEELGQEISDWVQSLLRKHTKPGGKPNGYLRLNPKKTQLETVIELGTESGTGARMKTLQHQLSGPFDLESLRNAEAGLNGLLALAELGLQEEGSETKGNLRLATVATLKREVRDDTLTRFSAYRLMLSLRQRRLMTDLTELKDGERAQDALVHDYQAAARRLTSAWAMNPSLVQVLRYALDLWPSVDLLEPVAEALLSKVNRVGDSSDAGRRVAYYVLADLFKAGATETGKESEQDSSFQVANVASYRAKLADLATEIMKMAGVPWYVLQQASLLLASLKKPAELPKTGDELKYYRALHEFGKGRLSKESISFEEEVVISLVGYQLSGDETQYLRWFIRCADEQPRSISKAWSIVADTAPELARYLLTSDRPAMVDLVTKAPRYLIHFEKSRWSEGDTPLPQGKWLPLLTVITHPSELFSQENALLKLAQALSKSRDIRDFAPELLTPLNVQVKSENWALLNNPTRADLEARAVETLKTTNGTYDTPTWCANEDAWMYAFGRLLRAAATGEPDFTARHWLSRENAGRYSGLKSTWHKRRLGMLHTAEGLRGTTAAITPWFSDLLLHLLRWPGITEREELQAASIKTRKDFENVVEERLEFQSSLFGASSGLPIYRYPVEWPLDQARGLRVAMVQGLMPLHADFNDGLEGLNELGFREKHRNHTAALLHITNKHLEARDYVLGLSDKPHFDLVVFPELCIHVDDQDLMRAFSDATGAMLFYGLLGAKEPATGDPINTARWLVPQRRAGQRSWIQVDQGKQNLVPDEKTLGIKPWRPYQVVIELKDSSDSEKESYRLTGSICYDATDISLAADLRDESHMYVVAAMNKDVKTFDSMVAALRYHMYQHVLIANIGEFGGSTAQAPYDKEHQRLISHSHGGNQLAVSVFDIRMEDFGPPLEAAMPGSKKMKQVTERIGKSPPAGLARK